MDNGTPETVIVISKFWRLRAGLASRGSILLSNGANATIERHVSAAKLQELWSFALSHIFQATYAGPD
jgi:hypothetical protein